MPKTQGGRRLRKQWALYFPLIPVRHKKQLVLPSPFLRLYIPQDAPALKRRGILFYGSIHCAGGIFTLTPAARRL